MSNEGFGSELWKNVQAVKLGKDGGIEAPIRANSSQGIVIGVDAVATSDASQTARASRTDAKSRGFWRRLFHR